MEEVRQLVQEEGREARNLVAFHVAVDNPAAPPSPPPLPRALPRKPPPSAPRRPGARRLRSASAGRDKRSELRARYWALLFGDLQRSIGEIYNTVEANENQNECQEVILVLENYTRDFKALGEWFRLKWDYDNTPPPQRPQSLAWEIRKTDFVRLEPRLRAYSVRSSPSVSGKNSPCLCGHSSSGKNSPVAGKVSPGNGKVSPRMPCPSSILSPKDNIEFFSSKIASKTTAKPEPKVKETRLSNIKETLLCDIKERDGKEIPEENDDSRQHDADNNEKLQAFVELGNAKECANVGPRPVIVKTAKIETANKTEICNQAKATAAKLDAMENEFLAKNLAENTAINDNLLNQDNEVEKVQDKTKIDNNKSEHNNTTCKDSVTSESLMKSDDNFADVSNDSSPENKLNIKTIIKLSETDVPPDKLVKNECKEPVKVTDSKDNNTVIDNEDVKDKAIPKLEPTEVISKDSLVNKELTDSIDKDDQEPKKFDPKFKAIEPKPVENKPTRPAYSQAAAKPKVLVLTAKPVVPPIRTTTPIMRSKTVVEIPSNAPKSRQTFPKRNQTSKCSYPFNLTTGRTSLFDASVKPPPKKPIPRASLGSGDTKVNHNQNHPKTDPKKRPPRLTTLKINEKGDKKEKANTSLEKIKDCDEYSSSDTIVTQIDMSRIDSSESLKTLVPEELMAIPDVANSIEVLNVQSTKNDEEWLTVKSRRLSRESKKQSKSHWANRFHQPSATTSLPTLNMIESPKQETNPIAKMDTPRLDRAKSEQPEKFAKPKPKVVKPKMKDPAMIRQKSDVTGLKTRSSRNKVTRKEKAKDIAKGNGELTKSRLHSSLESLTAGLERSQESTEDTFDFDKWKSEFKSTFKCYDDDDQIPNHNEILKAADPSEMSEIAEMTSQIEENERKISLALDFQSDADQKKLCEEEDLLNRQITELQRVSDIDLDTETDDTETDAEIVSCETAVGLRWCPLVPPCEAQSLEEQYSAALAGMSWAERQHTLRALEALVARDPGRAQQLHAKLSQGIKRRGSLQDALRRLQAKQARAEKQRLEYQTERAKKIHQLLGRVEEVKVAKNQLIEEKRLRLERRLQKAAENRDQHLKDIVRKAHDEEEKLREIAFIKQLEAENRRHDFLDQCRSHNTRLRQMRRDRLNKLEQKAARDAAVGARRQAIEAARKLHVETLLERRKERDARVEELKELKKQERDDAAREKAEGVKSRLSALAAAAELEADALRSRIRDKQDASQQRLESHLQAIREKATGPRQPTTSESEQTKEKELQEEAERLEHERRDREKQKAIRKRARKVKQKLLSTGCEHTLSTDNMPLESIIPPSNKMYKVIQQLTNILAPLLDTDYSEHKKNSTNNTKNNINNTCNDNNVTDEENDKQNKKNRNKNNKILNGHPENKVNNKHLEEQQSAPLIANGVNNTDATRENNNNNAKTEDDAKTENFSNSNTKTDIIIEKQESETNADNNRNENNKHKKKKSRNKDIQSENKVNDKPKLTKTSSVCSSLSDMSKASARSDKKTKVVIDTAYLDRLLNELHRLMDKFDKNTKDNGLPQKIQGLKVLGQLLAVAAERDDVAPQLNAKILTTCVTVISRVMGDCSSSAGYFITTNAAVHCVRLLAGRLEKDLLSEPRELELTKQLADCLSVGVDSVLCSSRLYDGSRDKLSRERELLAARRGRAHTLISYLCLSGCVAKAEWAGEARESVHTLLTVCADMCYVCGDLDLGPERASAAQSLRCALGTSICGARADFCSLFASDTDIEQCGGFVRAARTAHFLKAVAVMDHHIVQEAFGEGGWPLEFRAAVSRLLSQHAPNDRESPRTSVLRQNSQRLDQSLQETMVIDLLCLVGFVVVNNTQLQETICDGWSVIKTLCTLPANWLVSKPHCHALLPTLYALSDWPSARASIQSELSIQMLEEYMDSPEAQDVKLVQVIKQGRCKKGATKK